MVSPSHRCYYYIIMSSWVNQYYQYLIIFSQCSLDLWKSTHITVETRENKISRNTEAFISELADNLKNSGNVSSFLIGEYNMEQMFVRNLSSKSPCVEGLTGYRSTSEACRIKADNTFETGIFLWKSPYYSVPNCLEARCLQRELVG